MTHNLSRRAVLAGATAITLTSAKAGSLDAMQTDINSGLHALEVMGKDFSPYYTPGHVLLVREGHRKSGAHVVYRLKGGKPAIAELVHSDDRNAYLRGLKHGDRMTSHRWTDIKSLARIVATYRPA
jgi:hypothetical protein